MNTSWRRCGFTLGATCLLIATARGRAQSEAFFEALPELEGGTVYLDLMSGDGAVVVVNVYPQLGTPTTYIWTRAEGFRVIPLFHGVWTDFADITGDGSMLIGTSVFPGPPLRMIYRPEVGYDAPFGFYTYGRAISDDGSTIVMSHEELMPSYVDIRSPRGNTFFYLKDVALIPVAASGDGRVVVGTASGFGYNGVWRSVDLSDQEPIPGMQDEGHTVAAISYDGSVIVGTQNRTFEAYRWEAKSGVTLLGTLPGGDSFMRATGVSADGLVMAGMGSDAEGETEAVIWDAQRGVRGLRGILSVDYDLASELEGWTLTSVSRLSDDGRTFAGTGMLGGTPRHWIASFGALCCADWDGDEDVDSADFFAFIVDFLCEGTSCRSADLNGDGREDTADFFAFLSAFFSGCS